ncbi:peptidoglycan-binding domain-containing protein [Streptomyces sp. NPDC055287]
MVGHSEAENESDADDSFGTVTEAATKRFQKSAAITVDGIVGAQTWSFLTFWANSPDFVYCECLCATTA